MAFLLGIDIGTTGAKAVLIGPEGNVAAEAMTEYPLFAPRPGWSEQEPADWWKAAQTSIRRLFAQSLVKPSQVAGIGLSGQMHGLVLLDREGRPLRRCIMWNDQRTAKQCREITDRVGRERLIRLTGKPALTGFTAGKILWVREYEPEVFAQAATLQLPKDFVRYQLTGALAMDVADASGTNLLDTGRRQWSDEIIQALDLPRTLLPQVYECAQVCGKVTAEAAAATGLTEGTPVVAGAGDQAAQSIGTGITGPGTISVTIGTSGVVFAATDSYMPDAQGRLHAYCHAVPGKWHLMGVTLAAGGSLRWLRDTVCESEKTRAAASGQDAYDLMTEAASRVPPGCEGLLFLPYLSGERTPYPDPDARGVFSGLSLTTTRAHIIRAVLEGVTFSLRDCLDLLCSLGVCFGRIRVSGGGARSELWRRMMADVFNSEVVELNVMQGACYGAALLAGVGVGVFQDAEDACIRTIREIGSIWPGKNRAVYEPYYERFRALYPALKDEFGRMGKVTDPARE